VFLRFLQRLLVFVFLRFLQLATLNQAECKHHHQQQHQQQQQQERQEEEQRLLSLFKATARYPPVCVCVCVPALGSLLQSREFSGHLARLADIRPTVFLRLNSLTQHPTADFDLRFEILKKPTMTYDVLLLIV
jgi:hypothetical protein